jgi:hypothetical protein
MLAATSDTTGALELVRLALVMISDHDASIPEGLRQYFERVIREAKQLRVPPTIHGRAPLPESIELAYRIKTRADLSKDLEGISDIQSISPELASKLLNSMETETVYLDQFSLTS